MTGFGASSPHPSLPQPSHVADALGNWPRERHAELLRLHGIPAILHGPYLWYEYQRMVVALGPVSQAVQVTAADTAAILNNFPRAFLIRWSAGIDSCDAESSDWYNVVCESFTPLEDLPSGNTRSKLRRGLKRCETRRLRPEEMMQRGYEVYRSAHSNYGRGASRLLSQDDFCHRVQIDSRFEDIIEYWGCLCDGVLVAYSRNRCFGCAGVDYDTIKFDPTALKHYTSYALIHEMNSHYLQQQKIHCVNDGSRSLLHETEFQQFLVQNFGFRRASHRLQLRYRSGIRCLMTAMFPLRHWIGRIDDRIAALLEQERIRRGGISPPEKNISPSRTELN